MAPKPTLSRRAAAVPPSPIRRLAPLAAAARRAGKTVHALNIGQPDSPTPQPILERLQRFAQPNIAYGPSEGLPEFREVLRRYYAGLGLEVGADEIFVTTGASEALLFVFAALADPGDEILVFEPFYTNYAGFAAIVGARLVAVTTRPEDGYHLPGREAIEARLTSRTRAILLCSPNNPTGTVYTEEELERVAAICKARGLFLISDEVYREFTYDGRHHRSALTLDAIAPQIVVVDSLSKRVSLCGARVGCVVTRNRELLDALLRCGQARLCPPTLGQLLGCGVEEVPPEVTAGMIAEFQARRDLVYQRLSALEGTLLQKPEGAFYVCPRLPIDDGQRFAEFLLRDFEHEGETVMVAPADGFYATANLGRHEVRLAYVIGGSQLERALEVLVAGLEAYRAATARP